MWMCCTSWNKQRDRCGWDCRVQISPLMLKGGFTLPTFLPSLVPVEALLWLQGAELTPSFHRKNSSEYFKGAFKDLKANLSLENSALHSEEMIYIDCSSCYLTILVLCNIALFSHPSHHPALTDHDFASWTGRFSFPPTCTHQASSVQ